jgi:hypothetical protein
MIQRSERSGTEQCEILFELFTGTRPVLLGRLLRGHDAGRLVTLRRVTGQHTELAPMVDISRSIAHPSFTKVLGIARADGEAYLASEYMPGVSLFELRQAVIQRNRPLPAEIAARIVVDALKAATAAQRLLREVTGADAGRNVFAEHICVAAYGETLLTEVGVAAHLAATQPGEHVEDDVLAAAAELYALVTARVFLAPWRRDGVVPRSVEPVLERALSDGALRFRDVPALLSALTSSSTSPPSSEEAVSEALRPLVGDVLDTRRGKLDLLERASARRDADESTQFYRAAAFAALQERDTARPPPEPAPPASAPQGPASPAREPTERPARPTPPPGPVPNLAATSSVGSDDEDATHFWRKAESAAPARVTGERAAPRSAEPPPSDAPIVRVEDPSAELDDELVVASFRGRGVARWLFLLAGLLLLLAALALRLEH